MYHLKPNKLIIFDSYLSLEYDFQLTENLNLISSTPTIGRVIGLNFIGEWFHNGKKLEKATKIRIYQQINPLQKEDLEKIAQRIPDVEIDVDKVFSSLELLKNPTLESYNTVKENLSNLLNGINTYLASHSDLELKDELLMSPSVKEKVNSVIKEIYKRVKEG